MSVQFNSGMGACAGEACLGAGVREGMQSSSEQGVRLRGYDCLQGLLLIYLQDLRILSTSTFAHTPRSETLRLEQA